MNTTESLYVISVAARLVSLHPTTLRKYERAGFLEPSRTAGKTRLYSHRDIHRLRQIKRLVEERQMNLAGVEMALAVTEHLRDVLAAVEEAPLQGALGERLRHALREALASVGALEEASTAPGSNGSPPNGAVTRHAAIRAREANG